MRFLLYSLLVFGCLLVGAGTFLYVALPSDFVRDELIALVRSRTGHSFAVNGPTSISLYPDVTVSLSDVTLSPAPGMDGENLLTARRLSLKMPLWPLLRREIVIERFALEEPLLVLRTDKEGHRSWDFGSVGIDGPIEAPVLRGPQATDKSAAAAANAKSASSPAARVRIDGLAGLQLGEVRIESGNILLLDQRTGQRTSFKNVDVTARLASLDAPLHIEGRFAWAGDTVPIVADVAPASSLLDGGSASLAASFDAPKANGRFQGRMSLLPSPTASGRLEFKASSLRDLLAWLRQPLPAGPGFGATAVKADLGLSGTGLRLDNLSASLDGSTTTGALLVDTAGVKPMIRAALTLNSLNLNTYLSPTSVPPAAKPIENTVTVGKDASKPAAAEIKTAAGPQPWSTDPIDLSALRQADADVTLTLGGLQFREIKAGHTVASTSVKDGVLKTRFSELQLYGGKGTGTVGVDGKSAMPRLDASFSLRGVQALPFLKDTAAFERIDGTGDVSFAFTGSGRSQRDIVASLMGQGRIELADGAIIGVNVPQAIRSLQKGKLDGFKDEPTAKTDFSALSATCAITNGLAQNDDLAITGPLLRVAGSGTVRLPQRTLDYTANTMLVASLEGQGATAPASGLTLPVRLTGPLSHPNVGLDLSAMAKNPKAAVEAVKQAVSTIKGSEKVQGAIGAFAQSKEGQALGNLIGGLLGTHDQPAAPATEQTPVQ